MAAFGSPLATPGGQTLAPEPIEGDSLTQFVRSLQNLTGAQGQGIVGAGMQQTGAGLQQTQSGVTAAAPALDFLTKLVRGDQADVTQAAQPQIDEITQQFDQIRNLISQQPRGGGKASVLAETPFRKTEAVERTKGAMRTGAAGELGGLATSMANIGLGEAGVGLGAAGVGTHLEQIAEQMAMERRAQNMGPGSFASQFSTIAQGISGLISAII